MSAVMERVNPPDPIEWQDPALANLEKELAEAQDVWKAAIAERQDCERRVAVFADTRTLDEMNERARLEKELADFEARESAAREHCQKTIPGQIRRREHWLSSPHGRLYQEEARRQWNREYNNS